MKFSLFSNRLLIKLCLSFLSILFFAAIGYILITAYLTNNHYYETTQRLHANLAQHLIDEKFSNQSPFDAEGNVNKDLFGDIMHDMMAVNRAIEVYLLDETGHVAYSVVLDHDGTNTQARKIALDPIQRFIGEQGSAFILGDDPRNPENQKIFSAAAFEKNGKKGFIYIVLAGEDYLSTRASLIDGYFFRLGLRGVALTLIFAAVLGILSVWYLTKNLREIIFATKRFQEGDLQYRIQDADKMDLAILAKTYNEMADTIVSDIEKIKSLELHRRELIANISHDLRTPLSIIQGYVETLRIKRTDLTDQEREEYLTTVNNGCERLARLIAQLFEYSKLEANQIEPVKEPFLITELANDIHRNYKVIAAQHNIELQMEMDPKTPLVFGDISLVERAIQNLMDNAIKFTPDGGTVGIKIIPMNGHVEIMISDTGPGIQKEHQSLIFERYRQTKTGQVKEGAGLGLAIVKKIMELHNASIKVLSNPSKGTIFSFELPIYQLS